MSETDPKYDPTPGPWMIYEDGMIGSAAVRRFPEMTVIQPGTVKGETIGVAMANARLVAAAPLMYEFLKRHAAKGDREAITILENIHAAGRETLD